jgi:acyl carrier protein
MSGVSPAQVRAFVLETLAETLAECSIDPAGVPDDFDLLTSGVIDSFGVLEMISDVNDHFGLEIDFEELDPEGLTIIGRFSEYVALMAGLQPKEAA